MKDIHPAIYIGLPLGSFLLCLTFALIDPNLYFNYISKSESAYLEHSTVLMLLPAIAMAFWMFVRREHLPNRWLGGWALLLGLGALYFAGEEASWGQNYFGWLTPDWWSNLNDQGETNIHNTHGIFDQFPRLGLTLATIAGCIMPFVLIKRRRTWDIETAWHEWFWPTFASFPAALFAVLSGAPQKLYRHYGDRDEQIHDWFDVMFLRGQHSELKEHFLAMFIFMYIISFFWRYRKLVLTKTEESPNSS